MPKPILYSKGLVVTPGRKVEWSPAVLWQALDHDRTKAEDSALISKINLKPKDSFKDTGLCKRFGLFVFTTRKRERKGGRHLPETCNRSSQLRYKSLFLAATTKREKGEGREDKRKKEKGGKKKKKKKKEKKEKRKEQKKKGKNGVRRRRLG